MSTAYAFAGVTAVLRHRLTSYLTASNVSAAIGGVTVTVLPPDRLATGGQERNGLNLFLHRASRNQGWANAGPPPRTTGGEAVAAPPFGADLHYLVSAYGQDPLAHDILLGHAVAAIHEEPILVRSVIRRALAPNPPDPVIPAAVAQSALADQIELLRISLASPTSEELSRFWASFSAPYRPSLFFDVTVVLVDQRRGFRAPLPVDRVGTAAIALAVPEIDTVVADGPADTPITAASTLVITGRNLSGDGVRIRLGESVAPPTGEREVELRVPVADFVPAVQAGLRGLVVSKQVALGDPPVAHQASVSDAFPVSVRPTASVAAGAVTVASSAVVDGVATATGTLTVGVAPEVESDQQLIALLAEVASPADRPARGASLPAPVRNGIPAAAAPGTSTGSVLFAFNRLPTGAYVLRLRVDGVESPVTIGPGGRYDSPQVTV